MKLKPTDALYFGRQESCQTRYVRFKFPAVINRPTNTGFPQICLGIGALTLFNILQYNGIYFNPLILVSLRVSVRPYHLHVNAQNHFTLITFV